MHGRLVGRVFLSLFAGKILGVYVGLKKDIVREDTTYSSR